jgi:hypothetical protein
MKKHRQQGQVVAAANNLWQVNSDDNQLWILANSNDGLQRSTTSGGWGEWIIKTSAYENEKFKLIKYFTIWKKVIPINRKYFGFDYEFQSYQT